MNIALCSAFRNATRYLARYFEQVGALSQLLALRGDTLGLVVGEGDSIDGTAAALYTAAAASGLPVTLVDCTHGGPAYGSIEHPERFRQLATVGNELLSAIPPSADVLLWVESDLIWQAATLVALIDRLADYPAVSPMVMLQRVGWPADAFYDVWAFRQGGTRFSHRPPYHACYNPVEPFAVDSAGSVMALNAALARHLVCDDQVFVGICAQIRALGGSIWVDPQLSVVHE